MREVGGGGGLIMVIMGGLLYMYTKAATKISSYQIK